MIKLCSDCDHWNIVNCKEVFISPILGEKCTLSCCQARDSEWACGAEAKHFKPRIKTLELPQHDWRDDIPWHLAPWAKWFAVDVDGSQAFYSFEPQCTYSRLWRIAANSPEFSVYCSFNMQHKVKLPKNTDWRNTLTPRPEGK